MAKIKQKSNIPVKSRGNLRNLIMPGIGGTLLLAGAAAFVSPTISALVLTVPLTYAATKGLIIPAWHSLKQNSSNILGLGRSIPKGSYGDLDVSNGQRTGNNMVDALVERLRSTGLQVSTDWESAKEILKNLPEKYDMLKRSDANVYGFVYQGTIFLNPKETKTDVPIHEYTHLWSEALRQRNPQEWKNIVELMKNETAIWNEVVSNYPHLDTDDQIADEVLATYSGRHGAQRLAEHCKEGEKPNAVFDSLIRALERFWKNVSLFFKRDNHYTNTNDLADRILSDFLTRVNPNRYVDENVITLNDNIPLASQGEGNKNNTTMNERLNQFLSSILPEKGKIELPRTFCLDQPMSVNFYDMAAKYIVRYNTGEFAFSDGEYSLPISRLMEHQENELCELLEEYKNTSLQKSDTENNKISNIILDIRKLVGSHAAHTDVDVFLQNPVNLGHGMQVVGVNVALSNTLDDRFLLKNTETGNISYSDYRYYDGDSESGVQTVNVLNSKQLSVVFNELNAMVQRNTLIPISRISSEEEKSFLIDGVSIDSKSLEKLRCNPVISNVTTYGNSIMAKLSEDSPFSEIAFNKASYDVAQTLINRNCVIREGKDYVIALDTYSNSNLENGEEPLLNTRAESLKSLDIIAKNHDEDSYIERENDKIVKVHFTDINSANRFVSDYFKRNQIALSSVSNACLHGGLSSSEKDYISAYLVEKGGISVHNRSDVANKLIDGLNADEHGKEAVRTELQKMVQDIPLVIYRDKEAKDKFAEIMSSHIDDGNSDYYPIHIGATGIFEEKTDEGNIVYVAFDNRNGDNYVEDFKSGKAAEMYLSLSLSVKEIKELEKNDFKPVEKSTIEIDAQEALFQRIKNPSARSFTPEQKEALNQFRQSLDKEENNSPSLFYRLFDGIKERLNQENIRDAWISDARAETIDLFNGIERDASRGIRL